MYSFFFGNMLLPVTPQKLTLKIKGSNKTLTLINEGEISFLRSPGLTEISFDAVLPMLGQYSFSGAYQRPDYYLETFEKLMTERKPFRFIVSRVAPSGRLLYDQNMKVSLENYTVTEDATKGPDVVVSLSLKQYVDFATKTVTVVKPTPESKPVVKEEKKSETSTAPAVKTYTTVRGDCLWNLAKRFYGNGAQYMKIYNASQNVFKGRSPNLLYVGEVLTIP